MFQPIFNKGEENLASDSMIRVGQASLQHAAELADYMYDVMVTDQCSQKSMLTYPELYRDVLMKLAKDETTVSEGLYTVMERVRVGKF